MSFEESIESEEEILVFAEFENSVNIENYRSIHILGINDKTPILQMDETIFTGQLESPLGTHMFFAKDATPKRTDPLFDKLPKENMKYVCKASKYLNMKHTYITPNPGSEQVLEGQHQQAENEIIPITFKTVEEAIEMFENEWKSRIRETNRSLIAESAHCDQDMKNLDNKMFTLK